MKASDERSTPPELFKILDDEFHFELDVCAMQSNAKCLNYYHIGDNGLKQQWWPNRCFMNPPFSEIPNWLLKARIESSNGALVVCILPMDSSTKWFHEFIWDNITHQFRIPVRFPNKRYSFGSYVNTSKFSILIALFGYV